MMAARPRSGEAKKVAKGTGIMALTSNARLPRNKKSGLQFLIAAKDRGFPQRGGVSGHLRPRIGLTGGSKNDEFGRSAGRIKPTHFPAAYPPPRKVTKDTIKKRRQGPLDSVLFASFVLFCGPTELSLRRLNGDAELRGGENRAAIGRRRCRNGRRHRHARPRDEFVLLRVRQLGAAGNERHAAR